jgi:hypothetical protein
MRVVSTTGIAGGRSEQQRHNHVRLSATFKNAFQGKYPDLNLLEAFQGLFVCLNKIIILTSSFTPPATDLHAPYCLDAGGHKREAETCTSVFRSRPGSASKV